MPDAFQLGHLRAVVERFAFFRLFVGHETSLDMKAPRHEEIFATDCGFLPKPARAPELP
jgi:hypothetical protein